MLNACILQRISTSFNLVRVRVPVRPVRDAIGADMIEGGTLLVDLLEKARIGRNHKG